MKISHMIKRENFYDINERTLRAFFHDEGRLSALYIYPKLNAIVTKTPSRAVKRYIYTEYKVSGSLFRRIAARLYCAVMLSSFGLLAERRLTIRSRADDNTLIYPCNRKYRIFDFNNGTVSVIAKAGFPKTELKNEIRVRTEHKAGFIPPLLSADENGYSEKIIDGCPLARVGKEMPALSEKAYKMWREYASQFDRQVSGTEYASKLVGEITSELDRLKTLGKTVDRQRVLDYASRLSLQTRKMDTLTVSLSHGDLQTGNIWVDNAEKKLMIIDWETCGIRSVFYDKAVLFDRLRYTDGLARYAEGEPGGESCTVLLEELLFRLKELSALPENFGAEDFENYFRIVGEKGV